MSEQRAYFAIVGRRHPLENPYVVVRTGGEYDEIFSTDLRWERTDLLYRIDSGREYFDAVRISEEEGKRFEQVQAQRVAAARERELDES
jgi:hypothetical protein